jgi:16S rRNA (cytidine1402-2'-O)-methyltransferase
MAEVFLIPTYLHEDGMAALPRYIIESVEKCQVLFVENQRTSRRYLKKLKKEIDIDRFEWFETGKAEEAVLLDFAQKIRENKSIGILSEAGCPGVADPGQLLVARAQDLNVPVIPLVGPNAILLALMASGLNGQQFCFKGYLPINPQQRIGAIRAVEAESAKSNSTQIFIETPYRNNQLISALLQHCRPETRLCIAADITGHDEYIKTKTISQWRKESIDLHKKPAIFLLKG